MSNPVASIRAFLDGRPPALPDHLDRLAERWASLPPRARLAVGVVAVVATLLLAGTGAARSPWGPPVDTLVATRDLPAGHHLAPGDLEPARWPSELAPPAVAGTVGRTLTVGLPAGMPVTPGHLGDGGLAAQLREGEAAFPLTLDEHVTLEVGQLVDLVAGDAGGGGLRLAEAARVLTVDGRSAWLAVDRDDAPGLAGASAWGRIVAVPLPFPDRPDG